MPRSTYHDQFLRLIDKGYLIQTGSNGFAFYEVPQTRRENNQTQVSGVGLNFEECTGGDNGNNPAVHPISAEDIEINNKGNSTNRAGTNSGVDTAIEIKVPEVKEIHIPVPQRKAKKELLPKPERTGFVF